MRVAVLAIILFCLPPAIWGDSHAYVMSSGNQTPGAITPLNTDKGIFGAPYFVPAGGNLMAVAPGTRQIWQATTAPFCADCGPFGINVLDPATGSTLASIPFTYQVGALLFDPAGQYAYVATGDIEYVFLAKVDVATRTVVQTLTTPCGGYLAFSSDGSKLFVSGAVNCNSISQVDPQSMAITGSISGIYGQMFISGTTLLIINDIAAGTPGTELRYFNTSTLQQTNAVAVTAGSYLFGVSPDGSKIYLDIPCFLCSPSTLEILDFATGQILVSQNYTSQIVFPLLSPDGKRITVAASQILLIDAQTLATIKTINSLGDPIYAAYLDNDIALMLYADTGAMMVVDQSTAQLTTTFPLGMSPVAGEAADPAKGLVFTGSDVFYCDSFCPNLNVISTKSDRILGNFPVEFAPVAAAGDHLYGATGLDLAASVYNLSTGVLTSLPAPKMPGPNYIAHAYPGGITPDGKMYWVPYAITYIYAHNWIASLVAVYSTATNQMTGHFPVPLPGHGPIVFSPDSSTAYIGETNLIALYNAATLQQIGTYNYTATFTSLAISPDGSTLYGTDGTAVYVLDAATGAVQQTYTLPSAVQGSMALSPDGTALFLTDTTTNSLDLVQTANGSITVVPLPYPPTFLVVLP